MHGGPASTPNYHLKPDFSDELPFDGLLGQFSYENQFTTVISPGRVRFTRWVIALYNERDTREQHSKEGRNAVNWTRPSCRSLHNSAVRLQLQRSPTTWLI